MSDRHHGTHPVGQSETENEIKFREKIERIQMSLTARIGNVLISTGRKLARKSGKTELAVDLSEHSIKIRMVDIDESQRAWDDNLYRHGNVFLDGYANPIKPSVRHNKELSKPDTVTVTGGTTDSQSEQEGGEETEENEKHVDVMSSPRYQEYMRQDLVSQLLNPRQQWKIIAYAVIALAMLMLSNVVISLANAGVF